MGRTGSERGRTVATGGEGEAVTDGEEAGSADSPVGFVRTFEAVTSRFSTIRLTDPLSTRVATARGLMSLRRLFGRLVVLESKVDNERKTRGFTGAAVRGSGELNFSDRVVAPSFS